MNLVREVFRIEELWDTVGTKRGLTPNFNSISISSLLSVYFSTAVQTHATVISSKYFPANENAIFHNSSAFIYRVDSISIRSFSAIQWLAKEKNLASNLHLTNALQAEYPSITNLDTYRTSDFKLWLFKFKVDFRLLGFHAKFIFSGVAFHHLRFFVAFRRHAWLGVIHFIFRFLGINFSDF